jgi:hypothetical protein
MLQAIAVELGEQVVRVALCATSSSSPHRAAMVRNAAPSGPRSCSQIEECDAEGIQRIGTLSDEALLAAGIALRR